MSSGVWVNQPKRYAGQESKIPDYGSYDRHGNDRQYVKYVPVGYADTHSKTVGYLFWLFGFMGLHRFYYGKTASGVLWFFTLGLFGIGWIVDLFLIPGMDREADERFAAGHVDYTIAWLMLVVGGVFGLHRFFQERWLTGILFLVTAGFGGIAVVYDILTMNQQISERHSHLYQG